MSPQKSEVTDSSKDDKQKQGSQKPQQQQQQKPQQQQQKPQQQQQHDGQNRNDKALEHHQYPFENLVFQGGTNKLLAYTGAVKVLEDTGIWKQIQRLAGSGSGAVIAALLSVGMSSTDLEKLFKIDLHNLIKDRTCGQCGLCCMVSGGFNPGRSLEKWIGQRMKEVSGKANLTFFEVFSRFHKELCVVVTNLTNGQTEYHHPKTTPDQSVAEAVRMSLASPPLQQPMTIKDEATKKVYVGGGVLCNYPIHAFDGWWLSMDPEQSFFTRIPNLENRLTHDRFDSFNDKTLGFVTCNEGDLPHLTSAVLPDQLKELKHKTRPQDTALFKAISQLSTDRINHHIKYSEYVHTASQIMRVLGDIKRSRQESFEVKDAQSLINKCRMRDTVTSMVFGDKVSDAAGIVKVVQGKHKEELTVNDVYNFLEKRRRSLADQRSITDGWKDTSVIHQIEEINHLSILRDLDNVFARNPRNLGRTVVIETNYVDYKVNPKAVKKDDRKFLVEQGTLATRFFLEHYTQRSPDMKVQPLEGESFSRDDLKKHIDDDVSEVIDENDYMESYLDKVA